MGREIERKFLVKGNSWRNGTAGLSVRQGYLSTVKERVVRIRTEGNKGYVTIKGITEFISRAEYEYEIPFGDAVEILDRLCARPLIEKTRYEIEFGGLVWEVDEFSGDNTGLVLAEVELSHAHQTVKQPPWIGEEVSGDPRYYNVNLVDHPYGK